MQSLLEQHSFSVVTASDFKQLEELCKQGKFDVALVEAEIQPKIKKAIGLLLRSSCPWAPIVEMYSGDPQIPGAEPVSADNFDDLVPAILKALSQRHLKSA